MEKPSLDTAKAGAMRFNTDSSQLEIYDGNRWTGVLATSPEQQTGGTRGLFAFVSSPYSLDFMNIETTGNSADFGDGISAGSVGLSGDRTRAISMGGQDPSSNYINTIGFLTFATTGDMADFGDLLSGRRQVGSKGCNSTRTISMTGAVPPGNAAAQMNIIEYITTQSQGNSVDFGDLSNKGSVNCCSSQTRVVLPGRYGSPYGRANFIDYITTSTTGNSSDFGDLSINANDKQTVSNAVRGVACGGGNDSPLASQTDLCEFVTLATLGDAKDFGDLTVGRQSMSACSSLTRGVITAGYNVAPTSAARNTMDYIQIMTTGNAVDFGDATKAETTGGGTSNGHGGL